MTFDLERFVAGQRSSYADALAELRQGRKTGHWIWYVFPQLVGLGHSALSERYGIVSLEEARAYLEHPVLGPRLRECAAALMQVRERSADEVLGRTDAMKVRSSMTLFHRAAPDEPVFAQVLERFYGGVPDRVTDERLARRQS